MNIKIARIQKRMSQKQLGEMLGVTYQTVSRWENGAMLPTTENLIKLSDILGVSTDFLLGRKAYEN